MGRIYVIEVEFRGLKQTIDKHKLRCRNSDRLLVELDWSLRAMAIAELIALREQIPAMRTSKLDQAYDPPDRSLANTMRALRKCMRNLNKYCDPEDGLSHQLSQAKVQRYQSDRQAGTLPSEESRQKTVTRSNGTKDERQRTRKAQKTSPGRGCLNVSTSAEKMLHSVAPWGSTATSSHLEPR